MTCPGFSDRDRATRDMMGPLDAQQHLRAAMRYSTDPRWVQQQLAPMPVERRPLSASRIVIAVALAAALAVIAISVAHAAERAPAWDVFAFRDGRLLQADARNIVPVESKGPFPSKRLCDEVGIQTVKIRDAGWRLSCRRIDQ